MSTDVSTSTSRPPEPILSNKQIALTVYILYFASYLTGITALIGVVIAHSQADTADELLHSHYQFQIRSFWVGLLYLTVGIALAAFIIGIPIIVFWFIWTLVRNVKGILALNESRPIARPTSWMFG